MSTGTAKRQRREKLAIDNYLREHAEGGPSPAPVKGQNLQVLKTARKAQAQLASARAAVMAKVAVQNGAARELADLQTAHREALRKITDLKWELALVSFVLGSAVVLLILGAVI